MLRMRSHIAATPTTINIKDGHRHRLGHTAESPRHTCLGGRPRRPCSSPGLRPRHSVQPRSQPAASVTGGPGVTSVQPPSPLAPLSEICRHPSPLGGPLGSGRPLRDTSAARRQTRKLQPPRLDNGHLRRGPAAAAAADGVCVSGGRGLLFADICVDGRDDQFDQPGRKQAAPGIEQEGRGHTDRCDHGDGCPLSG